MTVLLNQFQSCYLSDAWQRLQGLKTFGLSGSNDMLVNMEEHAINH